MLLESIARHAAEQPDCIAYQNRNETLTYRDLWRRACALAGTLLDENGPVMVCGEKEIGMPVAFLACLMAGRPYLPADAHQPAARLMQIRQLAGAKTVLTCGNPPSCSTLGGIQIDSLPSVSFDPPLLALDPARDAYWIFTSGSSGAPKGVRISLDALENFVSWMLSIPSIADTTKGVLLNQARFSFDLSVADLWPCFAAGSTLRALEPAEQTDLSLLFEAMAQSDAQRLTCTPSFARLCLCDPAFCRNLLPKLKTIFFCGEILPPRTVRALQQRFDGLRILNAYGPTETTCAVCAVETKEPCDPLPVGRIGDAACRLLILDHEGNSLPEGSCGEIAITGKSVGRGYVGAPAGGFSVFEGQPLYRTGDKGVIRDGLLWYLGRFDRQIKYKGYRIEPGEIEAVLLRWPEVRAAAVLPLRRTGEIIGLAAMLEWEGTPLSPALCRSRLSHALPVYLIPKRWVTVAQMPVNPRGKCDLRALEEMLRNG